MSRGLYMNNPNLTPLLYRCPLLYSTRTMAFDNKGQPGLFTCRVFISPGVFVVGHIILLYTRNV